MEWSQNSKSKTGRCNFKVQVYVHAPCMSMYVTHNTSTKLSTSCMHMYMSAQLACTCTDIHFTLYYITCTFITCKFMVLSTSKQPDKPYVYVLSAVSFVHGFLKRILLQVKQEGFCS